MARERIVDIKGRLINEPKFYNEALEAIQKNDKPDGGRQRRSC